MQKEKIVLPYTLLIVLLMHLENDETSIYKKSSHLLFLMILNKIIIDVFK
jgi:hypothetical protein